MSHAALTGLERRRAPPSPWSSNSLSRIIKVRLKTLDMFQVSDCVSRRVQTNISMQSKYVLHLSDRVTDAAFVLKLHSSELSRNLHMRRTIRLSFQNELSTVLNIQQTSKGKKVEQLADYIWSFELQPALHGCIIPKQEVQTIRILQKKHVQHCEMKPLK